MNRIVTLIIAAATAVFVTGSIIGESARAAAILSGEATRVAADSVNIVENAQYVWLGRRYCWYYNGWHGPGWYRCGFAFRRGLGWGGGYGWHNWSGGRRGGSAVIRGGRDGGSAFIRSGRGGGGAAVIRGGRSGGASAFSRNGGAGGGPGAIRGGGGGGRAMVGGGGGARAVGGGRAPGGGGRPSGGAGGHGGEKHQ